MRRMLALTLLALFSPLAFGQDKLPSRFDGFPKAGPFRLTRVLGSPEIRESFAGPSSGVFSTDGKRGVHVEDLSTGDEKTPRFHSRLLIFEIGTNAWPREIEIADTTIYWLDLSRDGSTALFTGRTKAANMKESRLYISLWDLAAGKERKTLLLKNTDFPYAPALSPDGTTVLFGVGRFAKQWNIATGVVRELAKIDEHGVFVLKYLPDGRRYLSDSAQGVQLWEIDKPKPVRMFGDKKKGQHDVALAFSHDGKRIVTGRLLPFSLVLWETETGKKINEFSWQDAAPADIPGIALADDGKTVIALLTEADAILRSETIRLIAWDGETGKIKWSRSVPYVSKHRQVPLIIQDDKLLVGGGPNYLDTWSLKTGKLLSRQGAHKSAVHVVGGLQNGDILSGDVNGMLITWRNGALADRSLIHKGAITALAVNKDGVHYATAGADQKIYVWPLSAQKKKELPMNHTGPITSLAYSASGTWIASGSGDRTAKTWDLKAGKEIATFAGHSEAVNAVAISPDDRWLATGSDDATIKVWPIKDGQLDPDREPITLEKHTKPIMCLAFTPDGKRLLSGSQDQKLLVWDWKKGSMDFMIVGHKNWINAILLLDAKTVLTSSDDLSVCAWDLESGMEIGQIDFGAVGDCPRCLAKLGPDRFAVGSSSWLIYEFQLGKSKGANGSSNR